MIATIDNHRYLKPRMRCADDFVPIWRGCQFGWKSWNTDRNVYKKKLMCKTKNYKQVLFGQNIGLFLGVFTLN